MLEFRTLAKQLKTVLQCTWRNVKSTYYALIQCATASHKTARDLDELIAKFKQGHLDSR